ncbi:hypothetical protein NXV85_23365 [Bacteroides fragilis]|nr:hypothetical protein [Bacteroides fragilis]
MKYDYMKEFRNRDSRVVCVYDVPFQSGLHETIKGTFYFRWDPDLINKVIVMNHGPDILP